MFVPRLVVGMMGWVLTGVLVLAFPARAAPADAPAVAYIRSLVVHPEVEGLLFAASPGADSTAVGTGRSRGSGWIPSRRRVCTTW
jgi:hypothetical protein